MQLSRLRRLTCTASAFFQTFYSDYHESLEVLNLMIIEWSFEVKGNQNCNVLSPSQILNKSRNIVSRLASRFIVMHHLQLLGIFLMSDLVRQTTIT